MSGGAYGHLGRLLDSWPDQPWQAREGLDDMIRDCDAEGPEFAAAVSALRQLRFAIRDTDEEVARAFEPLRQVIHAIEWWQSGDWRRDQAVSEIADWASRSQNDPHSTERDAAFDFGILDALLDEAMSEHRVRDGERLLFVAPRSIREMIRSAATLVEECPDTKELSYRGVRVVGPAGELLCPNLYRSMSTGHVTLAREAQRPEGFGSLLSWFDGHEALVASPALCLRTGRVHGGSDE